MSCGIVALYCYFSCAVVCTAQCSYSAMKWFRVGCPRRGVGIFEYVGVVFSVHSAVIVVWLSCKKPLTDSTRQVGRDTTV